MLAVVLLGAGADCRSQIRASGIGQVSLRDINEAARRGARLKLICSAEAVPSSDDAAAGEAAQRAGRRTTVQGAVELQEVARADALASMGA